MPEPSDQVAITLPRAMWLSIARVLAAHSFAGPAAAIMVALRSGCQNGHAAEERSVRPNGELRCHACQRAAGARQRAKEHG